MIQKTTNIILGATLVLMSTAGAASVFGPLANFDVVNDTGKSAHGFEIEIRDIHQSNITSIFGDATRWPNMERYGVPAVTEFSDASGIGVRITYKANYGAGWSATTPSGGLAVSPSDSCWPLGAKSYGPDYPCDHFGVSTNVGTPNVKYSWLVEDVNPANLVPVQATVPNPVWTVVAQPPVNNVPQPPKVNVAIAAPAPNYYEFGEPRWVKVTATGTLQDIAVEDLVAENAIIQQAKTQVQIEWQLIQTDIGNPAAGQIDLTGVALDPGATGVVYRFEFYRYTGPRDTATNEAKPWSTSDTPAQPDSRDLGDFIVAQNAGVNFDGKVLAAPPLPIAPSINATIAGALVGQAYNQVIDVTPPNAGDVIDITVTGVEAAGLSFDKNANAIVGTPSVVGTFPLTIVATDVTNGLSTTATTNLDVADAPIVFNLTFSPASVGTPFSQTFSVTGGYGAINYSVFETLPDGLTLAGDTLNGTPTTAGSYPLTVTAKDSLGFSQNASGTLVVDPAPVNPPPPPPVACAGTNEVITYVTARDPVHIDIAGGVANGGKSVNIPPQNATTINPPLTAATAFQPGVLATYTGTMDAANVFCNAETLTLSQGLSLPFITLSNGRIGSIYGPIAVTPSGGIQPYSVVVANLPAGLSFDGAAISGTPTTAGTFTVGFSVNDSNGQTVFFNSQLVIDPPPPLALVFNTLPVGEVGVAYSSGAVSASGGVPPYSFAGVSLPAGLSVVAATGELSGTPTATYSTSITVQVTDNVNQTAASSSPTLQILAKVNISNTSLASGTRSKSYSATLVAAGGKSPYTWSLAGGNLPSGLSLNASTGVVSGIPTARGTFYPVFQVKDSLGGTAQKTLKLVIK